MTVVVLAVFAQACASAGNTAKPRPFPRSSLPASPAAPTPPTANFDVTAVVTTALGFRGTPYRNGGASPVGFDCSGFTQYVFAQHGVRIPREVRDQFTRGLPITEGYAPGDLIFFTTTSAQVSHVGLLIGDDQFVHAPSSRGVVRIERFTAPYWAQRLVGVRRLGAGDLAEPSGAGVTEVPQRPAR